MLVSVGSSNWTIQRVFYNPESKRCTVYYGQSRYTTLLNALQYLSTDPFTEGEFTSKSLVFVCYLIVKGNTTNLTSSDNVIVQAGLFRNTTGGSGAAGSISLALSQLSDVTITGVSNGQPLVYNSSTLRWENSNSVTASLSGNATTSTTSSYALTASLAPNYVLSSVTSSMSVLNALTASFYNEIDPIFTLKSASLATTGSNTFNGNQIITGSLDVTNGITGSLRGTATSASYALTASFLEGGASGFPFTGSAHITGSLVVTGSGTFTNSIILGTNLVTSSFITTTSGINTIIQQLTSSYRASFVNYLVNSGSNSRSGNLILNWVSSSITFTDYSSGDIGNTNILIFTCSLSTDSVLITTGIFLL
jgi:hypothetical protein